VSVSPASRLRVSGDDHRRLRQRTVIASARSAARVAHEARKLVGKARALKVAYRVVGVDLIADFQADLVNAPRSLFVPNREQPVDSLINRVRSPILSRLLRLYILRFH
jgi:hypothetical protein